MGFPVTYYCPRCGTLAELDRDGYLADKAVTPYPFEGWRYVAPTEPFEDDAADGVRFVCGESDGVRWRPASDRTVAEPDSVPADDAAGSVDDVVDSVDGCRQAFYLSFVRYEEGEELDPRPETELVEINPDPRSPAPRGPDGPGGFW